jgi:hypothetical protein
VIDWYAENVADTGRSPVLWLLLAFLITFAITRSITLRIRTRSASAPAETTTDDTPAADGATTDEGRQPGGVIKDVHIGGVHVHHQVWGILLVLVSGLLAFRYQPGPPWAEVLAALFGVGAALALDEFALWLHLEDVYWSAEGRKSIDAVLVAVIIGAALLVGSAPLGVTGDAADSDWFLAAVIVLHIGYTIICLLKGKIPTGLIGLAIPIVSLVGSLRLAKPESFWARRFYGPDKHARAVARAQRDTARTEALRDRFGAGRTGSTDATP